jgi:hypothetical protein
LLIEIKSSIHVDKSDLRHLIEFKKLFAHSEACCLSNDPFARTIEDVKVVHWQQGLRNLFQISN